MFPHSCLYYLLFVLFFAICYAGIMCLMICGILYRHVGVMCYPHNMCIMCYSYNACIICVVWCIICHLCNAAYNMFTTFFTLYHIIYAIYIPLCTIAYYIIYYSRIIYLIIYPPEAFHSLFIPRQLSNNPL